MPQPAYLLRIELRHLKPAIYREVLVDPTITLRKLHAIIQAAMGWEDSHLYSFALPQGSRGFWSTDPGQRFEPPSADQWGEPARNDAKFRVCDVLRAPKDKLLYLYDFGDDWEHVITLKQVAQTDAPLPVLVKAQAGCPPEDCGGLGGFIDLCQTLADPEHPEHAEMREWFGEREPGALDLDALQFAVARLQPKKRARPASP